MKKTKYKKVFSMGLHSGIRNYTVKDLISLKGKKIKTNELKLLVKFSKRVLRNAISKGGSSIRDFKNTDGSSGLFQNEFKVYNKENFICPNYKCKFKIIKINISNRSSFYCLNCQKK